MFWFHPKRWTFAVAALSFLHQVTLKTTNRRLICFYTKQKTNHYIFSKDGEVVLMLVGLVRVEVGWGKNISVSQSEVKRRRRVGDAFTIQLVGFKSKPNFTLTRYWSSTEHVYLISCIFYYTSLFKGEGRGLLTCTGSSG